MFMFHLRAAVRFGWIIAVGLGWMFGMSAKGEVPAVSRPNILWISSEDHGPQMGCYGDPLARTPHVDALARRGLRFSHCWSNAPVCAPARTTIITGMYPTALGAEHMRSMVSMPRGTVPFPALLRDAGYYCCNNAKEDYNIAVDRPIWDDSSNRAHYRNAPQGTPFFAVFNSTLSHESAIRQHRGATVTDPSKIRVPAYHPDTPLVRRDWAIYYDRISAVDTVAGEHLRELAAAGLTESTIVFYWGDHGSGMPRSKRWPGNSGLHVPLIVYIPESFAHLRPVDYVAGGVSNRPVSFVDFAPTVLSLAGVKLPRWLHGRPFLGSLVEHDSPSVEAARESRETQYLFGFRGRMDERLDLVRSVTDGRFVYLRNFMVHRATGQHVAYQMETPTTAEWFRLWQEGQVDSKQARFWQRPKDSEELYDLLHDPDEVQNLATSPEHAAELSRFREVLVHHLRETRDLGVIPEGMRYVVVEAEARSDKQGAHKDGTRQELAGRWSTELSEETLSRYWRIAHMASDDEVTEGEVYRDMLTSNDVVERYWGWMGIRRLVARGNSLSSNLVTDDLLKQGLEYDEPEVQLVAADCILAAAELDKPRAVALKHREAAFQVVLRRAQVARQASENGNSVFTGMAALDLLGEQPASRLQAMANMVESLTVTGANLPHSRYGTYMERLLEGVRAKLAGAED
jgi:uncharacterized sulfatase